MGGIVRGGHWTVLRSGLAALDADLQMLVIVAGGSDVMSALKVDRIPA